MSFVLDASLTGRWLFEDEQSPRTEAALDLLATRPAVVPPLWEYEMANVISGARRRGRITAAQAMQACEVLSRLPIRVAHSEFARPVVASLVVVAGQYSLSAYDAAYLWLAQRTGLPLGSCDNALVAAARSCGVGILLDEL